MNRSSSRIIQVSDAIDGLKSLSCNQAQLDALLKKSKDHLGQISSWSLVQLQNIGKMVKGLSAEDLAKIDKNKIKVSDFVPGGRGGGT